MKPQPITLFSASAGSGKTYTLTIEYIKMALSEVETKGYFRRILAVTFTIKAAEEMRQRILQFLSGISDYPTFNFTSATDQPKVLAIIEKIQSDLRADGIKVDTEELAFRASTTLQQILQDYGLFSVMTIDSFVQRLSASFIDELDLPTQYEVLLDSNNLIHELINRLLDQVNQQGDPELTELILSFANQEILEGRNWNRMRDSLHSFLRITLDESYLSIESELSTFQVSYFILLEEKLRHSMSEMVSDIGLVASKFTHLITSIDVDESVYFYGSKGPVGIMKSMAVKPEVSDKPFSYLRTAIDKNTWTSAKATEAEKQSIQQIASELSDLGTRFLELQALHSKRYHFIHWILKDLKKMALLNLIQKEMRMYQQEYSAIPISEFSKRVYDIISKDPIPFIYEKLGDRYYHIFIDEFQDTSILQWKNFMPLLENASSIGKRSLLVGDAKQSIYKFRGGEVGLIASLFNQDSELISAKFDSDSLDEQRFDYLLHSIKTQSLGDNYRSAKEIVSFNNSFFSSLSVNGHVKELCSLIEPIYGQHLIQNPKVHSTEFSGSVDLLVYQRNHENFGFTEPENEFMFEQVFNLIQHNLSLGFRYQDLAILTRKNKHSRYLALRLKEVGIPIVSSDSLLVHYSPVVGFILSYLALYENPDESLYLYELVYQFAELNGQNVTREELGKLAELPNLNPLCKSIQYFSEKGFSVPEFSDLLHWVYDLVSSFDLLHHPTGQEYLWKFLDIINEYVVLKDKSIPNFLQHFNQNRNSYCISSSTQENAVTISSIHKSKGLEYPVVILPFVNWTYVADNEKIWYDLNGIEPSDLVIDEEHQLGYFYGRVNASEANDYGYLVAQNRAEKEAIFLDSLNMLYVATTRPKQVLHLILTVPEEVMHSRTMATFENSVGKLVYDFAKSHGKKKELPSYLTSETNWNSSYYIFEASEYVPQLVHSSTSEVIKNVGIKLKNSNSSINLRVNSAQSDLYTAASQKREIGNQLHDLLSKLTDVESWPTIRLKANVDVKQIDDLLRNEEIQNFFKKDNLVFKEIDLLCPDGSIVRPDRVNKVGNDLQVIDFKTGKPKPEHHQQINKYKQILVSMGFSVCKGVLIYVETKKLEYV